MNKLIPFLWFQIMTELAFAPSQRMLVSWDSLRIVELSNANQVQPGCENSNQHAGPLLFRCCIMLHPYLSQTRHFTRPFGTSLGDRRAMGECQGIKVPRTGASFPWLQHLLHQLFGQGLEALGSDGFRLGAKTEPCGLPVELYTNIF